MASINGISIKNWKTFRDHEGCPISQGTVYIDGKKAGYWSQDAWGGPDQYETSALYDNVKAEAIKSKEGFGKDYKYYDLMDSPDILMSNIVKLLEHEKMYKKIVKQGYPCMLLAANSAGYSAIGFTEEEASSDPEVLKKNHPKDAAVLEDGMKSYKFAGPLVWFAATSLKDFDITIDKNNPVPAYLL